MVEKSDASEKKPEKAPLNEQIADITLKVLMTDGFAGGGFGAFWSLFKDSDIHKVKSERTDSLRETLSSIVLPLYSYD
jgi:hypothetical protein